MVNEDFKKILFIGPLPPPYSGPELSMQQFLESDILNEAFEIDFLKTNFRKVNKSKGKFGLGMVVNFFSFFTRLIIKLLLTRPNLIYYPITATQVGWLGRDFLTIILGRLFSEKIIIHLRGSHFKINFQNFQPITKNLVGYALEKVDTAIVQAIYLKDQFNPYIHPEDVEVLYQAMDPNAFPPGKEQNIQQQKILTIGHMTKAKGYTDILKVIPAVVEQFPNVKFYFAGELRKGERNVFSNQITGEPIEYENPFEAEKTLLKTKYAANYINLGLITGKNKLHHLQTMDIYLTASYSEGFSRALLEAMSVGRPLVYTPVGAHREVLNEDNGFSFNPGDLIAMKNALLSILNYNKRNEIGNNNRDIAVNTFAEEHITKRFQDIIQRTFDK